MSKLWCLDLFGFIERSEYVRVNYRVTNHSKKMRKIWKMLKPQEVNCYFFFLSDIRADIDWDLRFQSGLCPESCSTPEWVTQYQLAINRLFSTVFHILLFITRQVDVYSFLRIFFRLPSPCTILREQLSNFFLPQQMEIY